MSSRKQSNHRLSPQYIEESIADPINKKLNLQINTNTNSAPKMSSSRRSKRSSRGDRERDRGDNNNHHHSRHGSSPREERERNRESRRSSRGGGGEGSSSSTRHNRRDRERSHESNGIRREDVSPVASPANNSINTNNNNNNNNSSNSDMMSSSRAMGNNAARSPTSEYSIASSKISDAEVQLDLPMADLMAYLQVVANNSSNLPLTRRDDPELGRTVSSLTSEEYAFKCAAFVPSNVRILGGQFGKYGRVWDLPTSEEFDVTSSAREPGISHGGSCCNALLKAMYDTESEVNVVASPHMVDAKNLFDDDDDETVDTAGYTVDRTLASFDTLVLNDGSNASTMTWAQLLRKMKPEMQGVGFNQVPAVTSSYKFDLNEPFSLVPPNFPKDGSQKKRALLIGCNYRKTPDAELKACHDDVRSMKDFLVNVYGFPESKDCMTVLMDDKKHKPPSHTNITQAFKTMAERSEPGDAVFVLFTGHGCRVLDSPIDETAESYDEALLPSDYEETGIIRDTLFFKTLLAPMRKGVTVTCIIDCCHTGAMIDLPYLWTTKGDKGDVLPKMTLNNDFSFVRFLKVVKTLYESSVFTRIGKTVGSELDKQAPGRDDETVIETVGSLETMPENEQPEKKKSFFETICSPATTLAQNIINCTLQAPDEYSDDEATLGRNNTLEDDHSHYSYDS
ncbi:hypothetical protein ACHAXR_009284 [Thalassiosira sp. AJA248-18]